MDCGCWGQKTLNTADLLSLNSIAHFYFLGTSKRDSGWSYSQHSSLVPALGQCSPASADHLFCQTKGGCTCGKSTRLQAPIAHVTWVPGHEADL
ncbi:hypothetical protein AV530_016466 [Patagioenas fasciata monilis]|uniref:Uncharacterized protein n=1 Tax=Patagioenas fasciata monilis TaxID=372326 RepID=A0A1V4J2K6_PATFA|nr:hypothetical protein AV530_016466 [Patagioenas fasciata monilis]